MRHPEIVRATAKEEYNGEIVAEVLEEAGFRLIPQPVIKWYFVLNGGNSSYADDKEYLTS